MAESHEKHSILIRDTFTFRKGTGLRLMQAEDSFYTAEKLISSIHSSECKDIAIFSSLWNKKYEFFLYVY